MPDVAYLHVGPHKTGTTALQHAFSRNAKRLGRYGIHYPETGRLGAAHQTIARACRDQDYGVLQTLHDEIQETPKVLLSSELFGGLGHRGLHLLRNTINCDNVQIAYTLRRLPAHWASHWKELIKHGQPFSFSQYLALMQDPNARKFNLPPQPCRQIVNFERLFGRWRAAIDDLRCTKPHPQRIWARFCRRFPGNWARCREFFNWPNKLDIPRLADRNCPTNQRALDRQAKLCDEWAMRAAMLDDMRASRPNWVDEFIEIYEQSEPTLLCNDTPMVKTEQAKVISKYNDVIIDPIDAYLEPMSLEVRDLDPQRLPRYLLRAIEEYCESLAARIGPNHTHPDLIQDKSPGYDIPNY